MRQYWLAPLPPFHTADGTAYTGTAALGDISPAPPIVIPANMLEIGSRLEINCFGRYTSTATQGTITVGAYIGPTATAIGSVSVLAVSATLTPVASQTNRTFRIEGNASVRSVGTAGTIIGSLEITNVSGTSPLSDTTIAPYSGPAAVAIDTTVNNSVRIGVTPSVTTGSWQCMYLGVRLVN